MKAKLLLIIAALLAVIACHKGSDPLENYSFYDFLAFDGATNSFGKMFEIVWKGLNSNYPIWDVEEEYGLDWDDIYEEYYPKFCDLDSLDTVTDDDLHKLMEEAFGGLHEGHLYIIMNNYHTGSDVRFYPSESRLYSERYQEVCDNYWFYSDLSYYEGMPGELLECKTLRWNLGIRNCIRWVEKQLQELYQKTMLTDEEFELQKDYQDFVNTANEALDEDNYELLNMIVYKYKDLGIPGLDYVDTNLLSHGMDITFALFRGNIAYLYFDLFRLTSFLDADSFSSTWANSTQRTLEYTNDVKEAWNSWFYSIQRLHEAGKLGGVIIDVRSNRGGSESDFQYALGALVPSGGLYIMDHRYKRGTGRYDYSPLMPYFMDTYPHEHVTVTEPIVVLANCLSGSMADATAIGTKSIDNAVLIGTRTRGALENIISNYAYSVNYAGLIGEDGVTPVYCHLPFVASFTKEGESLESIGVTPDIEVAFDAEAWNYGAGPDNQLDRALEYIRKGK